MNEQAFSEQLSRLPDEMVEEAMTFAQKWQRRRTTLRILQAAACLAVILGLLLGVPQLLPGTPSDPISPLVITAFAADCADSIREAVLTPTTEFSFWTSTINALPGLPFMLSINSDMYNTDDITFCVTTDDGMVFIGENGCNRVFQGTYQADSVNEPVLNNTVVYWTDHSSDGELFQKQYTYINITVYEDNIIVGYAVLLITNLNPSETHMGVFSLSLLANEAFTEEDQNSGKITEEYVRILIQEFKQK